FVLDGIEQNAEITTPHLTVGEKLFIDLLSFFCRQRKAYAVIVTGRCGDLRIDADDLTGQIDQRPAGVSTVDGRVRLYEFLERRGIRRLTFGLRYDACCNRTIESKGRTYCQNPVAYTRTFRI